MANDIDLDALILRDNADENQFELPFADTLALVQTVCSPRAVEFVLPRST